MRRALAAACVALLLAPGGVAAQPDPDAAEPVVGGGSYNDAPVLEPGVYRDTILPRETIYYAVELDAGQQFTLDVRFDTPEVVAGSGAYSVNTIDPLRNDFAAAGDDPIVTDRVTLESDRALTPELDLESDGADRRYQGPGAYYFTFVQPLDSERAIETPVTFELAVEGDPAELPPAETPEPTPTPTPAATPAPEQDDDSGGFLLPAAVGLVAGAALGFGGVAALRR